MAKTFPFKIVSRAFARALFLEQNQWNPELESRILDAGRLRRPSDLNRRDFLKNSLALGASLPFLSTAACTTALKTFGAAGASDQILVLGGGVAGLTAAYRLAKAGQTCSIYEAQSRLGGRIFTNERFNSEGMFCELGGELIDTYQHAIVGLARELSLELDDLVTFDADVKEHDFYVHGRHYFDSDFLKASRPLVARMAADMRAISPKSKSFQVTYSNHNAAAVALDRISLKEYLHSIKDLAPWMRDGINYAYLTEFGMDTEKQSSLNLMSLLADSKKFGIYGDSDEGHRIHGGNSRLIDALAAAVQPKAAIHLRHRLTGIKDKGSSFELTFQDEGKTRTVSAGRIICTVPFSVLRSVDGIRGLELSPAKARAIQELGYGANTKHMVGFSERYWRKPDRGQPGMSGYTFTDLPTQTFWDSSRAQPGKRGIITAFLGGTAARDPVRCGLDSVLVDLEKIHPGVKSKYDGNQAFFRWDSHPYSLGSYSCASVGQYCSVMGSAAEPELGGRLLFAGEHVSEAYQGYMNGAIETANAAVKELLAKSAATA